jgi:hypothetical protein
LYAALGQLKATDATLTDGEYKELHLTTRQYAFARVLGENATVTVLNNDDAPAWMDLALPVYAEHAVDLLADCVGAQPIETRVENGRLQINVPANYGTVLRLVR